jgi:outer membrane protein assembly factor BamD
MVLLVFSGACSHTTTDLKKESAEEIYSKAVKKLERKKFIGVIPYRNTEEAIELFQQIIDNYPNSKYALLAEIGLADAYFFKDEYDEAQSRYSEFYNLHPGNEYTPYAIYMSGRCFEEMSSDYDRDLTPINNAIAEFTKLKINYKDSKYTEDATKRLTALYEKVAMREFYVARFYYRRKLYHSAIERLKNLLNNYPEFSLKERALYYIYNAFSKINDLENAKKYYNQLVHEFPETNLRDKVFEETISSTDTSSN